jgi:hypothetical protein
MIQSRALHRSDIEEIRELHERFYPDLEFPDFLNGYLCGFIITDETDEIVMAGGLQPIAEIVLVTNKDKSRIKIGRALIEAKNISLYVGKKFNLKELVAFVKNEEYARHLVRHDFFPRSPALGIKV